MDKKNPWSMDDATAFAANLKNFAEESGGIVRLYLIRKDDLEFAADLVKGDPLARRIANSIVHSLNVIAGDASSPHPRGCLACGKDFDTKAYRVPHAFLIVVPGGEGHDQKGAFMCMPLCGACCKKHDDGELAQIAVDWLSRAWMKVEIITIPEPPH